MPDFYQNTIRVSKKFQVANLFLKEEDPGDNFQMSEWKDYKFFSPDTTTAIICLAKKKNNEIFKAIYFFNGYPINWCTYEEGYAFPDNQIKEWAYITHIGGQDRKDVKEWKKVRSESKMSEGNL